MILCVAEAIVKSGAPELCQAINGAQQLKSKGGYADRSQGAPNSGSEVPLCPTIDFENEEQAAHRSIKL
jgi:hypothetical protein